MLLMPRLAHIVCYLLNLITSSYMSLTWSLTISPFLQTVVLEEHRDVVLKVNMLNSNDGGAAVMAQKMKANAEQRLEIQQLEDQLPPLTFRPSFHDLELKGEKQNTKVKTPLTAIN